MAIEYEATFEKVDKETVRARLRQAGAHLVRPEFLQKRIPFWLPAGKAKKEAWLRVRDEGDRVTLSLKAHTGERIEDQTELCLTVDSFDTAVELLETIGCRRKSYQESKRELWMLDGTEITIDEWPFLEPFVEVEGGSEAAVRETAARLGFDYGQALFCAVGTLYERRYGFAADRINRIERLVFDMDNPFLSLA
jgi:adenylate cyclase class 2